MFTARNLYAICFDQKKPDICVLYDIMLEVSETISTWAVKLNIPIKLWCIVSPCEQWAIKIELDIFLTFANLREVNALWIEFTP